MATGLDALKGAYVPLIVPFEDGNIDYDTSPITTKYMVKRRGRIERNEHRLPMTTSTPELERRFDGVLSRAGLI